MHIASLHLLHPHSFLGLGHCRAPEGQHHVRPWFLTTRFYVLWLLAMSPRSPPPSLPLSTFRALRSPVFLPPKLHFSLQLGEPRSAPVLGSGLLCLLYPSAGLTSPCSPLPFLSQHPLIPTVSAKPSKSNDSDYTHTFPMCQTLCY